MRGIASLSVVVSLGVIPSMAHAHGPPESLSVTIGVDEKDLVVGTSFGVLRSDDGGESWTWLCENAVGYSDLEIIPRWVWLDDGTLAATTTDGISTSRDGGCTWSHPSETTGNFAGDIQKHPSEPGTVIATLRNMTEGTTAIVRSTDGAATFPEVLYSATGRYVTTVSYAPSDPQQIYAAAISATGELAWVLHSPDAGATWTEYSFVPRVTFVRILGIDPVDPSIVYVAGSDPDATYRSTDSGETFDEVRSGFAQAFVTSADGQRVWISDFSDGLFKSEDRGLTFSPVEGAPHAKCLTRRGNTIYACGNSVDRGENVLSRTEDGTTFAPVMETFGEMDMALSCPAGTVANDEPLCAAYFPTILCSYGGIGEDCQGMIPTNDGCGCSAPGSTAPGLFSLLILAGWALYQRRGRRQPRSRP
jgi:MYXO-CTERM domain-containing protein